MLEASSDQDYYRIGHQDTWALVDLRDKVATPADVIVNSSFFVVMASSPQPTRWKDVKRYRGPITFWFMKPFSLAELIQASVFLARNFSCHLCDIPVVKFKRMITKRQILRTSMKCTDRQPVIVTLPATSSLSTTTINKSA